jgi:hypothetical protein
LIVTWIVASLMVFCGLVEISGRGTVPNGRNVASCSGGGTVFAGNVDLATYSQFSKPEML